MGIIQKLRESIFGVPKEPIPTVQQTGKAVLGVVEQTYGIYQVPSFRQMVTTFWDDPILREAIQMMAEQVVSTGFYLTGNPEYKLTLNGKSALDVIKEWCDENNIDTKLLEIAIELRAFGNSFWRIDEQYGFVKIPIEAVWRAVPIDSTTPLQVKYNIQLVPLYGSEIIPWGEFIHFRINVTGYRAPLGIGVIHSIIQKPVDSDGNTAPSIYDIRLQCRRSLHEGFRKFSFGNIYIGLPGMSNEDFTSQNIAGQISKLSSVGNRIVTNTDVKVQTEVPQRTETYDKFIQTMQDEFYMSLGDPSLKLGLEKGFTKSTALVASDFYKNKIANYRKCIAQQFEDLFKQILNKLGYDGVKAGIKFNFGPEETPKYSAKDVFTALQMKAIGRKEARHLLRTYLKWDIPEDEPEDIIEDTKMNILGKTDTNPEQISGRKYEPLLKMKKEESKE